MIGVIIFTIISLILGTLLVITDIKINKQKNEITSHLPGYNCGACGYGSCLGMEEAIEENIDNYKKCKFIKDSQTIEYFEKLKGH